MLDLLQDNISIYEDGSYYIRKALEMGVKPATLDRLIDLLSTATAQKDENNRDEVVSW